MDNKLIYPHSNYLAYVPDVYHHCRLDNFDFSQNKGLIKIVQGFITRKVSGIYFHGTFGTGKTHLAVSLYRIQVAQEDDSSPEIICFSTFEGVLEDMKYAEDPDSIVDFLGKCETLYLDDITVAKKEDMEILRKIINLRYETRSGESGRLVLTGNLDLKGLLEFGLHPHAISRFTSLCEVVEVKGLDRRRQKK